MTKYRFFYHFNKKTKKMTVHFKGQCLLCQNIVCRVPCNTKWNKRQPYLVMQGFAASVTPLDDWNTMLIQ